MLVLGTLQYTQNLFVHLEGMQSENIKLQKEEGNRIVNPSLVAVTSICSDQFSSMSHLPILSK